MMGKITVATQSGLHVYDDGDAGHEFEVQPGGGLRVRRWRLGDEYYDDVAFYANGHWCFVVVGDVRDGAKE